ncbi:MAG: DNA-protecting protein DprA [Gammaproteobacteria bacterium]|nr:DNA-protecting protein DprA [Gammaproteobacteria bacterium]
MEHNELRNIIALHQCKGIGSISFFSLVEYFQNDIQQLFKASTDSLNQIGLNKRQIDSIKNIDWLKVDEAQNWAQQENHHIITFADNNYPDLLQELPDRPPLLYLSGNADLLNSPQIALVGSRTATPTGIQTARHFSAYLAQNGLTITSGMALGIDTASHLGALDVNGNTIAVTGTGLDRIYPSKNKALAYQIFEQGLLVSEFSLGTSPSKSNFPRRNRIISGLSVGTLVIEATEKSGSLITAYQAIEQGREVFAIPGSIHNPHAKGCHKLIKNGAKLVDQASDIIEELGSLFGYMANLEKQELTPIKDSEQLDTEYQHLLEQIGYDGMSIDEIVFRSGLTIDKVSSMLLILELKDHINTVPGGLYARTSTRFS